MNQFHFQDEEALKAQRISDEEARRVVALWAEKQKERDLQAGQATVQAVAEGLDIPAEEVLRLLGEVRASEAVAQAEQARKAAMAQRWRMRVRTRLAAVLVAFAVALLLVLLSSGSRNMEVPASVAPPAAVGDYVRQPDGTTTISGPEGSYVRGADGSVTLTTPEGSYEYRADGSLRITGPKGSYRRGADGSLEISGPGGSYIRRADGSEERHGTPPVITAPKPPPGVTLPDVPSPVP